MQTSQNQMFFRMENGIVRDKQKEKYNWVTNTIYTLVGVPLPVRLWTAKLKSPQEGSLGVDTPTIPLLPFLNIPKENLGKITTYALKPSLRHKVRESDAVAAEYPVPVPLERHRGIGVRGKQRGTKFCYPLPLPSSGHGMLKKEAKDRVRLLYPARTPSPSEIEDKTPFLPPDFSVRCGGDLTFGFLCVPPYLSGGIDARNSKQRKHGYRRGIMVFQGHRGKEIGRTTSYLRSPVFCLPSASENKTKTYSRFPLPYTEGKMLLYPFLSLLSTPTVSCIDTPRKIWGWSPTEYEVKKAQKTEGKITPSSFSKMWGYRRRSPLCTSYSVPPERYGPYPQKDVGVQGDHLRNAKQRKGKEGVSTGIGILQEQRGTSRAFTYRGTKYVLPEFLEKSKTLSLSYTNPALDKVKVKKPLELKERLALQKTFIENESIPCVPLEHQKTLQCTNCLVSVGALVSAGQEICEQNNKEKLLSLLCTSLPLPLLFLPRIPCFASHPKGDTPSLASAPLPLSYPQKRVRKTITPLSTGIGKGKGTTDASLGGSQIRTSILATAESGQVIKIDTDKITLRRAHCYLVYSQAFLSVVNSEYIKKGTALLSSKYEKLLTGDIVQGLGKIEELLESPKLSLNLSFKICLRRYLTKVSLDKAIQWSYGELQERLVQSVQQVYVDQGCFISDKHLEIIVRQATSLAIILFPGDTGFLHHEVVLIDRIEKINKQVVYESNFGSAFLPIVKSVSFEPLCSSLALASVPSVPSVPCTQYPVSLYPCYPQKAVGVIACGIRSKESTGKEGVLTLKKGYRQRTISLATLSVPEGDHSYAFGTPSSLGSPCIDTPLRYAQESEPIGNQGDRLLYPQKDVGVRKEITPYTLKPLPRPKVRAQGKQRGDRLWNAQERKEGVLGYRNKGKGNFSDKMQTQGQKAIYYPHLKGITWSSLNSDSILSAASFQETRRVLRDNLVTDKVDFLKGIKERIILGELLEMGTGFFKNHF